MDTHNSAGVRPPHTAEGVNERSTACFVQRAQPPLLVDRIASSWWETLSLRAVSQLGSRLTRHPCLPALPVACRPLHERRIGRSPAYPNRSSARGLFIAPWLSRRVVRPCTLLRRRGSRHAPHLGRPRQI